MFGKPDRPEEIVLKQLATKNTRFGRAAVGRAQDYWYSEDADDDRRFA